MQNNQVLTRALSVDPGDHSGWAFWTGTLLPRVGQFNVSRGKQVKILEDELSCQWKEFCQLLDNLHPKIVFLEGVEFWEGSLKSVTAAKRQNLSKLSYLSEAMPKRHSGAALQHVSSQRGCGKAR